MTAARQRAAAARAAMQAATTSKGTKVVSLCSSLNAEYGAKVSVRIFLRTSKWPGGVEGTAAWQRAAAARAGMQAATISKGAKVASL